MNREITPVPEAGDYREGGLEGYSAKEIAEVLGFKANVADDPDKVKYSWGFTYKGVRMGIWDYKGSHRHNSFSTFGPKKYFNELFPSKG